MNKKQVSITVVVAALAFVAGSLVQYKPSYKQVENLVNTDAEYYKLAFESTASCGEVIDAYKKMDIAKLGQLTYKLNQDSDKMFEISQKRVAIIKDMGFEFVEPSPLPSL